MMSRVEFLKKFVAFNKRHKVPLPLIKAQLYVILVVCFIHYAIVKGIGAVKNAICSPFIKLHRYINANIAQIFQVECVVATMGICFLLVLGQGGIALEENVTGALAGETVAEGSVEKESVQQDMIIHDMVSGSVSNGGEANTPQEETTTGQQPVDEEVVKPTHPYKIAVNRLMNCITIYTLDEEGKYTVPYKAMICSTGGNSTPSGTFKISSKYTFKALFYKSYGQYCSRIYGSILFHSSGNNSLRKNDLNASDFNQLGEGVSHGCIRLTVADAKWIYDNCPSGTVVVVYDSEDPGPLGKPECIKVPEGTVWDPTDPDPANPWHEKQPTIVGATDRTLYEGDVLNYIEGVKAYDTCGNDITEDITVKGYVDMSIPGEYIVTYSVTDLLDRTAEVSVIYTVR